MEKASKPRSWKQNPEAVRSVILIVQTHLRDGEVDEARAYLDEVLARSPDVPDLRLLDADLNALMGRTELAERGYRDLIADAPENETAVHKLASILSASGRHAEAATLLAAAAKLLAAEAARGAQQNKQATEALELLFPDAGFELFPSGTELKLHASGGLPPVVSTTPAGPGLVRIDLGGLLITFEVPEEFTRWLVDKGSVAIDGVSLTVCEPTANRFDVAVIPVTLEATNLGAAEVGQRVNLEADPIGKWVARLFPGAD